MKDIFSTCRGYLPTFWTNRKIRQLGAVKINSTIIRILTTKAAIEEKTL